MRFVTYVLAGLAVVLGAPPVAFSLDEPQTVLRGNTSANAGSCTQPRRRSVAQCEDYLSGIDVAAGQQECQKAPGAAYSAMACTTKRRIGHCDISQGTYEIVVNYYSPTTLAYAMGECTSAEGHFTAG